MKATSLGKAILMVHIGNAVSINRRFVPMKMIIPAIVEAQAKNDPEDKELLKKTKIKNKKRP